LCVSAGSQDFATHFLDEALFYNVTHIDDLPFLQNAQVALGVLFSYVAHRLSYLTRTVSPLSPFSSLLFLLVGFDKRVMEICGDIIDPKSWESFQGPLMRHQVQLSTSFDDIGLLSMEDFLMV
jgi:hypothetical protein